MRKRTHEVSPLAKLLVLVDESNIGSSVRTAGRGLDWLKLRDFLAGPNTGRELIEMVVYAGLPPAMPIWQEERDKKNKFMQWLRSNGFMVVTKDGSPAEEGRYKANVDVMMAIDASDAAASEPATTSAAAPTAVCPGQGPQCLTTDFGLSAIRNCY